MKPGCGCSPCGWKFRHLLRRLSEIEFHLQQCVLNLILNAFDSIAAAKSQRREVLVRVVQEEAEWVSVSVRDSGQGIDPSVHGRLFEPFVTTKWF